MPRPVLLARVGLAFSLTRRLRQIMTLYFHESVATASITRPRRGCAHFTVKLNLAPKVLVRTGLHTFQRTHDNMFRPTRYRAHVNRRSSIREICVNPKHPRRIKRFGSSSAIARIIGNLTETRVPPIDPGAAQREVLAAAFGNAPARETNSRPICASLLTARAPLKNPSR